MTAVAVDTSALVAIAAREPGYDRLMQVLLDEDCLLSAPTLLECYLVLRGRALPDAHAGRYCQWLVHRPGITVLPFDVDLLSWAQFAFDRFGKRLGSGVGLNYGDCMSYAAAARADAPILSTGGDFAKTDLKIHPSSTVV